MKAILHNAKVYVEKGSFAEAVLVEDGYIAKVGTNSEILDMAEGTETVTDCGGRTLIPGLNDSHLHFMAYGVKMNQAQIGGAKSIDEMIEICSRYAEQYPKRVAGGLHAAGWNQDLFTDGEKRMPNRHDLDKISTEFPILLERACCHVVSINTKLAEVIGLEDSDGILRENECDLARAVIPGHSMEERREFLMGAMRYAAAHGITSVQSNDNGTESIEISKISKLLRSIYAKDEGLVRYRQQLCFKTPGEFESFLNSGDKQKDNSWLTTGPLKLFKDGSLGGRTALMKDGYAGDRENHGLSWISVSEMEKYCRLAEEHGIQVITHAIGDKAIEETLDSYENAMKEGENKLRHGLVHCQITDETLLQRIADMGILVMAQPIFLDYDMKIVENLCGKDLASTSYAFNTLGQKGVHVSYGTDCPIEDCNPFPNIYAAVTRKDMDGKPADGFYAGECVDVETAVDAYTLESAYAEFAEDRKGRIKAGYYADMVLLDRDIFTVSPEEIKDILPVMTMVGGKVVYDNME